MQIFTRIFAFFLSLETEETHLKNGYVTDESNSTSVVPSPQTNLEASVPFSKQSRATEAIAITETPHVPSQFLTFYQLQVFFRGALPNQQEMVFLCISEMLHF